MTQTPGIASLATKRRYLPDICCFSCHPSLWLVCLHVASGSAWMDGLQLALQEWVGAHWVEAKFSYVVTPKIAPTTSGNFSIFFPWRKIPLMATLHKRRYGRVIQYYSQSPACCVCASCLASNSTFCWYYLFRGCFHLLLHLHTMDGAKLLSHNREKGFCYLWGCFGIHSVKPCVPTFHQFI